MECMYELVLEFLKNRNTGATPTEIWLWLWRTYTQASASVNKPLKELILDWLIKKTKIDWKTLYTFIR